MAKLLLILSFFTPLFAHAAWSQRAIEASKNLGYFPGPSSISAADRGAMATVWGGGMREVRFQEDMKNDEYDLKIPTLFAKELKVFLRKQPNKAPLMVVIPGVFANGDDGLAKASTKWFSKMGYHVLTMPNCWSKDFAKAKPIYKDEYPSGEAKAVQVITEWAIRELGAANVTTVQLFGESLGALTVSVVYARDSQSPHPVFTAGATMTWPPIALHNAIGLLDSMITSTTAKYESQCHGLLKKVKTKWRILRGKYITQPTPDEIDCSQSIVAQYAFRKELVKLAKTVNKTENLGRDVPDDLTFSKFIQSYAPRYAAALKETDEYGSLRYWLHQTSPQALTKIRVLTSADDFLNDNESWDMPGSLDAPTDQLIVAHWGGHIGLTDTKAYQDLLDAQFDLH